MAFFDKLTEMANLDKQVDVYFVCEDGSENLNTEIMLNLYADASDKISVKKVDPVYIQVDEPFLSTGMVDMKTAREAIDIIHDGLEIPLGMHVCGI